MEAPRGPARLRSAGRTLGAAATALLLVAAPAPAQMHVHGMEHALHAHAPMAGMYGPYPLSREASGTAWQPDASLHEGFHLARGPWTLLLHGYADLAEAHDLLARACEHLGDRKAAAEHAEEARAIDPESYPPPLEVSDPEFDALVQESLRELPAEIRRHLEEWPVVVETLPTREILTAEDPPISPDVLGLFVGQDLMRRGSADLPSVPGAIYLFRRNLLRVCADREELKREVRITVQHEVGHLLGLDEDDLERWGLA